MLTLLDLDPNIVKPGWIPLLITIALAAVMVLLFFSLRKQFRRIDVTQFQPGTSQPGPRSRGFAARHRRARATDPEAAQAGRRRLTRGARPGQRGGTTVVTRPSGVTTRALSIGREPSQPAAPAPSAYAAVASMSAHVSDGPITVTDATPTGGAARPGVDEVRAAVGGAGGRDRAGPQRDDREDPSRVVRVLDPDPPRLGRRRRRGR